MIRFYNSHFSSEALSAFSTCFFNGGHELYSDSQAIDLDLGFYDDGNPRTLTDDQIAIFRHTEIHSLLSQKQQRREDMVYDSEGQKLIPPAVDETSISPEKDYSTVYENNRVKEDDDLLDESSDEDEEMEYEKFVLEERLDLARTNYDKAQLTMEETPLDYGIGSPKNGSEQVRDSVVEARRIISYEDISESTEAIVNRGGLDSEKPRFIWPIIRK